MCEFCDEIESWKNVDRFSQNARYIYKCRLTRETLINSRPSGTIEGKKHNVNYCPLCGRKITEV